MPEKPEIAHAYDRWSNTYNTDRNRTRERAYQVLRQVPLPLSDRDLIEIGCGTGLNTQWLAEQARSVVAVDFSPGMLERAKELVHSPRVRFIQHDINSPWPVATASADVVIAMLVLEHISDLEPIFKQARRTLRPDGELFLCELHPTRQLTGRQAEFMNSATGELERIPAFLHDVSEYVNVALSAGFQLVRLGEWRDEGAPQTELPRVLSVHLKVANVR